jgi:LPS export ABC transporter protein LptC
MNHRKPSRKAVERHGVKETRQRFPSTLCLVTVLLDAVLVLGCGEGVRPTATTTVADSADQVLVQMKHYVTTDGILRALVLADTAYFFNARELAELRVVHVTFYDAQGSKTSTLTANAGTFHWRTRDMDGRGNVVVIRNSDGGTLHTEAMKYGQARNEVSSDLPFTFDAPTQHLKGVGFTADPDFKNLRAWRVTGTGGQFVLPKH